MATTNKMSLLYLQACRVGSASAGRTGRTSGETAWKAASFTIKSIYSISRPALVASRKRAEGRQKEQEGLQFSV
jgi:hypothetical protein